MLKLGHQPHQLRGERDIGRSVLRGYQVGHNIRDASIVGRSKEPFAAGKVVMQKLRIRVRPTYLAKETEHFPIVQSTPTGQRYLEGAEAGAVSNLNALQHG